jgi:hypothetical protein
MFPWQHSTIPNTRHDQRSPCDTRAREVVLTKGSGKQQGPSKPRRGSARVIDIDEARRTIEIVRPAPTAAAPTEPSATVDAKPPASPPPPAKRRLTNRKPAKTASAPPPKAANDPTETASISPASKLRNSTKGAAITVTQRGNGRVHIDAASSGTLRPHNPLPIFQIYYEPWHIELLDPAFEPFDNSGVVSEFLEYDVFSRLAASPELQSTPLWGALSWRFGEKTGISGDALRDAINANPGFDLYYCNPYPENEALFHNMWLQGETCHPRFLELARAVFAAAGLPEDDLIAVEPSALFSAANYFVGSPKFWSLYLAFVRRVMGLSDSRLSREMRELLHSPEADKRAMHNGATYVVFIIERLLPTFLKTSGRHLKTFKVALPDKEAELNVHIRLLREMKDVAHKTKSAWLAACWINYRNLYFAQSSSREWCATHLRNVTPTSVRFG